MHHRLGSVLPNEGENAKYAQVYMYDGEEKVNAQLQNWEELDREVLQLLNGLLRRHNPYALAFKMAAQRMLVDLTAKLYIRMVAPANKDPRRYNRPVVDEIAGIIIGDELGDPELKASRDIIVERNIMPNDQGGPRFQRISELHPSYFPLRYPFIFLYGEQGWHQGIPLSRVNIQENPNLNARRRDNVALFDPDQLQMDVDGDEEEIQRGTGGSIRVSQVQFYSYHLQSRAEFSPLLWAGRLLQEMIIDAWICVKANRLNFQRQNQVKLHADCYSGLEDAVAGGLEDDVQCLGKQIILASSFIGGPRHMRQQYQDAMAICRHFGKPDFFITFTCNPTWPEIHKALLPGQRPHDAPQIVCRVFHLKLQALLDDLVKRDVLGKVKAHVYMIKFQK